MSRELVICYRSCVDQAWVPFDDYGRRELRDALRSLRALAHGIALNTEWCLKRKRKVICRIPRPKEPRQ
jgi:hypothetical protein